MRVVCRTIEAFIENLRVGQEVVEKTVWVDEFRERLSDHKFRCNIQASAVMGLSGGGEFLLQYGEDVGFDFTDGEKEMEGTAVLGHRKGYLKERCEELGLVVRPGMVSE